MIFVDLTQEQRVKHCKVFEDSVISFYNISVAATGIEASGSCGGERGEAALPDKGPAQQDLGSSHPTKSMFLVPQCSVCCACQL